MGKMLAIFCLATVIVSMSPSFGDANQGSWEGVARLTALIVREEKSNVTDDIKEKMEQQMKDALGPDWVNTTFKDGYNSNTGTFRVSFPLKVDDPVENTRAMVSLAEKTIDIYGVQLTPVYTIETTELYYPVTKTTTRCDLREIMDPCEKAQQCKDGECEGLITPTTTTTKPPSFVRYKQDTNLFIVLGIAGGLSVVFLGFLIIYCWRKGIAVQKKYTQNEDRARSKNSALKKNAPFTI